MKFSIIFYETTTQNPVRDFILSQDPKTQLKIDALLLALEKNPFELKNFSKKLTKDLYELRLYYSRKWYRIIYAFVKEKIIILLHGFIKKTKKTPMKEIKIAKQRLFDYKQKGGI